MKKILKFLKKFRLPIILLVCALGFVALTVKIISLPLPEPVSLPLSELDVPVNTEVLLSGQLNWDPERIECFTFPEFKEKLALYPNNPLFIGLHDAGGYLYVDYWLLGEHMLYYHCNRQIKIFDWNSIRRVQYKEGIITLRPKKMYSIIIFLIAVAGVFAVFTIKIYSAAK